MSQTNRCLSVLLFVLLACAGSRVTAQYGTTNSNTTVPSTLNPNANKDTTHAKTNTAQWKDEEANLSYQRLGSARTFVPDTSLHTFQRRPFVGTWARDLGNPGSPVYDLAFNPENRVGPSSGYHAYDAYRFVPDSLNYYTTNRPYSVFEYQLGSKLEQTAGILHTQNIRPNWNFMVQYRKVSAPGFYKTSRNNHDNAALTTNYKSLDKHYTLYAAVVYNKEQHDENGGIVNDSELSDLSYIDRQTVDVAYQNSQYSLTRSTVSSVQRDFGLLLQHSYTWGRYDTTYNADSTGYTFRLTPRFSITHKMELSSEKHTYKDVSPDSVRYVTLFDGNFINNSSGYYVAGADSVVSQQKWFYIDNRLLLNGFAGKEGKQLKVSAGLGNRFDGFATTPANPDNTIRNNVMSNYACGSIENEAVNEKAWQYGARALFYLTGDYAGNFSLNASLGKAFGRNVGFLAGFDQQLGSAPYSYTTYANNYTTMLWSFNKQTITDVYATVESRRLRLSAGVKNYVVGDYIYIAQNEQPAQYNVPFNLTQAWLRKIFRFGNIYLDNELMYQQTEANAPVNVPALMARHQISYEHDLFKRALKIATGAEVRYNTSYHPAGYDALLNRFFYQNGTYISNTPELSAFLNFRIKHFRAFIMADQLQQIFSPNTILFTGTPVLNFSYTGSSNVPVYAAQNFMIRFGFSWVLIN